MDKTPSICSRCKNADEMNYVELKQHQNVVEENERLRGEAKRLQNIVDNLQDSCPDCGAIAWNSGKGKGVWCRLCLSEEEGEAHYKLSQRQSKETQRLREALHIATDGLNKIDGDTYDKDARSTAKQSLTRINEVLNEIHRTIRRHRRV